MAKEEAKNTEQVSKSTGNTGIQSLGTTGSAAKKNEPEVKRAAPRDPNADAKSQVGYGFGNNANKEQVTTGTLLVDPKDTSTHVEVKGPNQIELAVTAGPQAYAQTLRTAEPNPVDSSKLTLVKIKYPANYEGQRFFADDTEVEVSPESAWHYINVLKIGTEVK